MNPWMNVPENTPGKFRVGDRVRLLYNVPGMIAEVVEDRGPILAGGRRMYGVKFRIDEWNEVVTERPEDTLEAVAPEPRKKRTKKRKKKTAHRGLHSSGDGTAPLDGSGQTG
jgi:hypothetical protein